MQEVKVALVMVEVNYWYAINNPVESTLYNTATTAAAGFEGGFSKAGNVTDKEVPLPVIEKLA